MRAWWSWIHQKIQKASVSSDSTTIRKHALHTLDSLTHCGMWLKASRACRWMWDGASRSSLKTNVVMWLHVWTHTVIGMPCMHACILHHPHPAPTYTCHYLRSHTPFSCELPPPVTFLLSNTRASLKLTSPESSDSSPRREQEWEVGRNWWVTGVPDSRLV